DRQQAISRMSRALSEYEIGGLKTTIPFLQYPLKEWDGRLEATNLIFQEDARHPRDGLLTILPPGDHFRDERVIEDGHLEPGGDAAVVSNPRSCRRSQVTDQARSRHELLLRILGVHPAFDRVAVRREQARRVEGQTLTLCDPDLPLDQIEARDHLGHRMLDLKPRVHFEKV